MLGLLCAIWGSTWLVIQDGLTNLPPLTSLAARLILAAAIATVLAPRLYRVEGGERPRAWLVLVVGSLQLGYSYAVIYLSETRLPSGLASLLWSVFPMMMAASGHFFLPGERLRRAQWLGFVVGLGGVVLLFAKVLTQIGPAAVPAGLFLLTSPLCSTVGNTLLKRWGSRTSAALLNRNALWVAALWILAATWIFERDAPAHWTPRAVLSVVYLALFGTALAFGIYFWLLRSMAAHRLSLIAYVNPTIALLLGWAVGREPMSAYTLAGAGLVLCGVVLVVRGPDLAWRGLRAAGGAGQTRGRNQRVRTGP